MPILDELRRGMSGRVITPGDREYESARRVWNGDIDRRPAVIARCTSDADVATAIKVGRHHGLQIAVRGGGHSFPGLSTCDGGMVIDLSSMRGADIDPFAQRALVGGGALLGDFDRAAQEFGQVTPAGVVSHTGVAGLTLGGGYGYLSRRWGLSCDNFLGARLVTAEGEQIQVDDENEPELMWGLRGGGGNFGVVTEFEFQTYPLGSVLAGWIFYRADQAPDFLRHFREFVRTMPDELCTLVRVKVPGTTAFLPPSLRVDDTWFVGVLAVWSGDLNDGIQALAPLLGWGPPVYHDIRRQPYISIQASLDGGAAHGVGRYERSGYLEDIPDGLIDDLLPALEGSTDVCEVSVFSLGGAAGRVGEQATAYSSRSAPLQFEVRVAWQDPGERDDLVGWTRDTWSILNRWATGGVYVNLVFDEEGDRVRSLYGDEKFERLRALKSVWDPDNVFRLNQNIPPLDAHAESQMTSRTRLS